MKNSDQSVDINHNLNYTCVPDHSYRILTITGSRSGKSKLIHI